MSCDLPEQFSADFEIVEQAELERIKQIRQTRVKQGLLSADDADDSATAGLALSGGGIRSAAFGLGVLHALERHGLLYSIDYLSTVSGGGYIGSTWTYLEAKRLEADRHDKVTACTSVTEDIEHESQGGGGLFGSRFVGAKGADAPRNGFLNHIRSHGNYLTQGDNLGLFSLVAMVARSIMLGVLIWIPIAALVLTLLWVIPWSIHGLWPDHLSFLQRPSEQISPKTLATSPAIVPSEQADKAATIAADIVVRTQAEAKPWTLDNPWLLTAWLWVTALLLLTMGVLAVAWSLKINAQRIDQSYGRRVWFQQTLGLLLKGAMILLVIGTLPLSVEMLRNWTESLTITSIIAFITSLLGGITAFQGLFAPQGRPKLMGPLAIAGASLMLYGTLMLSLLLANLACVAGEWGLITSLALLLVALCLIWSADLNLIALHRLYRDRLMETFMPNFNKREIGRWHQATDAEKVSRSPMSAPQTVSAPIIS